MTQTPFSLQSVRLTCSEDSMEVEVRLDEDFDGVFYTRGSYSEARQGYQVSKLLNPHRTGGMRIRV